MHVEDPIYLEYLNDRPGLIRTEDNERRLYDSRPKVHKTDAFQPCDMTPDDVDFEMSFQKSQRVLEIHGMNQESLEHFVNRYGSTYEYIHFFHCQKIKDFSPLEDMPNLRDVDITWNNCATRLWNLSRNPRLVGLGISDAKKLTAGGLPGLETGCENLRDLSVRGDVFNGYPMPDLNCFSGLVKLRRLELQQIKPADRDTSFLNTLPVLEEFHFDPGMFTTEQIARLCAKYPNMSGRFMCAYAPEYPFAKTSMRVSGYRKPTLDLDDPSHRRRLERYEAAFEALVEQYRMELIDGEC